MPVCRTCYSIHGSTPWRSNISNDPPFWSINGVFGCSVGVSSSCADFFTTILVHAVHGYHKQAIWAWSKYIRMKRREYEPQFSRLLLFVEHINAQSNPRQARRVCSMAVHAATSMLRTFPGDSFASLRLPEFHYKAGESSKYAHHVPSTSSPQPLNRTCWDDVYVDR